MTTQYSTQRTKMLAVPPKQLAPDQYKGRVRVAWFDYITPAGGAPINDLVELCTLPAGARVLGGEAAWEAMTSGGAAATMEIGTAAAVARYLEATSVDAVGNTLFANTVARNMGDELAVETVIIAKATVEAWAAAKKLVGWIRYALD